MSNDEAITFSITPEGRLLEAIYLAWWKQKMHKQSETLKEFDWSVFDWAVETPGGRDWHTIIIPNEVVIERLRKYRTHEYAESVDELERYCKEDLTGYGKEEDMRRFFVLAFQIGIEELEICDNDVHQVVGLDANLWERLNKDFVSGAFQYRH